MRVIVSFILGLLVGAGAMYVLDRPRDSQRDVTQAEQSIANGARDLAHDVKEGTRTAARAITEGADDAVISGKIKARFAKDDAVPAMKIDVDTTEGVVTLSGKVDSKEQADRAVTLAKSVEGVREVRSTLLVAASPSTIEK